MTYARIDCGKKGEALAKRFLKKHGYKILVQNYCTKSGEIDIIADDKKCTSFIEVRSVATGNTGPPEYTINRKKQAQITKAALLYIKRYGLEDRDCRFDVVCIKNVNGSFPEINLIKNAFEMDSRYLY